MYTVHFSDFKNKEKVVAIKFLCGYLMLMWEIAERFVDVVFLGM